jgi:DUF438 domain-containing protein
MSEFIDNHTKRKDTLKQIITRLHDGQSVDDVKAEFAALLGNVGASEISEVEQALIDEGLSEDEVKRLCDVHVAVFRESLETQVKPDTIPGHPVYTFLAENGAADRVLLAFSESLVALRESPSQAGIEKAAEQLRAVREYEKHYQRKENILFPYLERHGFSGPSSVMWAIHDDVRADWRTLTELLAKSTAETWANLQAQIADVHDRLDTAIREMFYKEENILFPTALEKLNESEWAEIRAQEQGIGYAYVEPGSQWGDAFDIVADQEPTKQAQPLVAGLLHLDTGSLTPNEVNLMLKHLPVDITYVDKSDRVRFFSQGRERIFPRSPAIIGREVQKCHPPSSVHQVQNILDDFKAGRRDQAEFWIRMRGQFVYIQYFAMRDEAGIYQGTVEVTQEIGHIRSLQGERRLIDEEE